MHERKPKRKALTGINIYREACRNAVACHPELHVSHKVILMRLTDYVNQHTGDAFVGEVTLARDCNVTERSVRRALNRGKELGIIKRTYRGTQWTGASHHIFLIKPPETTGHLAQRQPDTFAESTGHFDTDNRTGSVRLTSEITPENITSEIGTPPSAVWIQSADSRKGLGEGSPEGPEAEPSYLDIKSAILASWGSFSPTTALAHMKRYGPAKTLEVIECSARLGYPDIAAVLDTPLMVWSAPTITEIEYTPELQSLFERVAA